eukprot:360514-Amphidinium_carterae.1
MEPFLRADEPPQQVPIQLGQRHILTLHSQRFLHLNASTLRKLYKPPCNCPLPLLDVPYETYPLPQCASPNWPPGQRRAKAARNAWIPSSSCLSSSAWASATPATSAHYSPTALIFAVDQYANGSILDKLQPLPQQVLL